MTTLGFKATEIMRRNAEAYYAGKRRALNEGGTSSSKTYSIMQLLSYLCIKAKTPLLCSVVSESFPHLRRGAMRDFRNIMAGNWDPRCWWATESLYNFGMGKLEFFSVDDPSKVRGARRKILFLNEANNVSYEAFQELDIRTELFTFLDWNPVSEFWAHEHLLGRPENQYIHSTYLDAKEVLPQAVIDNIESRRDTDPNWWNIYGLGRLGKIEGLVYPVFEQCDKLPPGDVFYGLDFGYSNDPTALVANVIQGDSIYSDQLIYETGLTNDAIAHKMGEAGVRRSFDEIFADAAEPKSIEEIYRFGFNIKAAPKGAGSVEFRHQKTRQYKQYWTKRSIDCIKEQRNFRYILDKNGKYTEKTTHTWSHGMDARDYGIVGKTQLPEFEEDIIVYDSMQLIDREINMRI